MKKKVTIHDIARMANVSAATVSRVLSNSDYPVSQSLREKILKIAAETNYVPNLLGKQLKKNTSTTIGVVVPSIVNPFYSSVILGIEQTARQRKYTVITCNSMHDPELESEYIRMLMEKQVKGLIIASIANDGGMFKQLADMGIHVIAIDQRVDAEGISKIDFDFVKGGQMATRHLIDKGHRRIAYLTARMDRPSRRSIFRGYQEAMKEAGLEPILVEANADDDHNPLSDFDTGRALARKLLAAKVQATAVFTCNDMLAIGVINELSSRNIRVPEEISVMGFDGIDVGQMIHPPLTTIKQPDYEMGKMACTMLLNMMNNENNHQFEIILQPKLIERQSVVSRGGHSETSGR
ncbi:MAG: LacI family transcriptional regulator [Thermobacillus sp. ZCTH02-B1]|mgnify:CR=1 FL=1|uniref:LacI family DNA-binding transcriptional regulator n=1 Tax=Thermobacillus sp. ZCTH02-B1 TaxID=1858795 RepID=UPI000B5590DC|nr:LacI family DNA-binding transcriptional regulator [Thermobacillus sp. ZCTH02-B1]OUM93672.1 MAG: LacI family transcriptional regulator [Thermobacillus sp. ZCTH02-B1]